MKEKLEINKFEVEYEQFGTGPELLFIHGSGNSYKDHLNLLKVLSRSYRVTAFSFPLYNTQFSLLKNLKYKDYLEISEILIQKLEIKNPILVGYSLGGRIALDLSFKNNLKFDHVVLLHPLLDKLEDSKFEKLKWIIQSKLYKFLEVPLTVLVDMYSRLFKNPLFSFYTSAIVSTLDPFKLPETLKSPITIVYSKKEFFSNNAIAELKAVSDLKVVYLDKLNHYSIFNPINAETYYGIIRGAK